MTTVGLVWAQADGGVIGADGGMPWHVPEDLAHFRQVTGASDVIMGRRTWESLPPRFRPLPGRRNIVVTRSPDWNADGAEPAASLDAALALARGDTVWIIGGGRLYAEAVHRADVIELTRLDLAVDGDTYAPAIDGWERDAADPAEGWHTSSSGIRYRFETYRSAR
ncbi:MULTISPECIES: dihydrofolate reductase [Microbacterium]|uniref:dihydrofolate reductase n=1 Tax=Microbacterium TaxID=33882 RepID=UPI0027889AE3|nr:MULTISPECIES: dihydrofolate reductase [Microbacterium]MDQ1083503.1 dihydrofolate reductase [Microbacterium sp. SORGH_AS_0344]MDQ1171218.1 dihydrofolate reductase [Microbacterium proteolyticum]